MPLIFNKMVILTAPTPDEKHRVKQDNALKVRTILPGKNNHAELSRLEAGVLKKLSLAGLAKLSRLMYS
jgi:hypothetical protein